MESLHTIIQTSSEDTCERTILDAIDRQVILDRDHPLMYNKLVRYYEDRGVQFYGNVDENYDILLSELEQDFYYDTN